jgi:Carboxypeptidase regulatory-like domain
MPRRSGRPYPRTRSGGRVLAAALVIACCASSAMAQQSPERHHIRGQVVDATGAPIQGAEVSIATVAHVVALRDGRFDLGELAPGDYTVHLRHVGFYPLDKDVALTERDVDLVITMQAIPTLLDTVTTTALKAELPRLFHRMDIHLGRVAFGEDLRIQYPNAPVSDYLKDDRGLSLMLGGATSRQKPLCAPGVITYVDGRQLTGVGIDQAVQPRDIAAIEAFESPDFVNERFIPKPGEMPVGLNKVPKDCTRIILVWTNYYKMHPHPG